MQRVGGSVRAEADCCFPQFGPLSASRSHPLDVSLCVFVLEPVCLCVRACVCLPVRTVGGSLAKLPDEAAE